jgi:Arc/MetJ-type ribon-helix-helix transcriptional regulator
MMKGATAKTEGMPTKDNIIAILPGDLREIIERDVQAGDFANADEAIRKAMSDRSSLAIPRAQSDKGWE